MLKNIRLPRGKALRNPALYVMHHGARYLFPLVLTPYLARQFGPSYFADFVIWNSCVWTASLFMEYGFFLYAVNQTALARDPDQMGRTLSTIVSAKLSLLPLALVVYALLVGSLGIASRQPAATAVGVIAVVSYGASFAWYFQGNERAATAVSVEAFPQVIQFMLVFLLVRGEKEVWVAALLQTLAGAATVTIAMMLIVRDRLRLSLSLKSALNAIKSATPFFIERFCLTIYQTATPLFIGIFSFREQAAFYNVGDKFLQFLGGLSIPLSYAFLPIISKKLDRNASDWNYSITLVVFATATTAILAISSALCARFVITLLFKKDYVAAVPIAQCLCVAACFVSYNTSIANFVLIPGKRAKFLIMTSLTALTLSLSSQVLLLPTLGAVGSAVSRTVAELGVAIILTFVAFCIISGKPRLIA